LFLDLDPRADLLLGNEVSPETLARSLVRPDALVDSAANTARGGDAAEDGEAVGFDGVDEEVLQDA
jgi:hypothetical protein